LSRLLLLLPELLDVELFDSLEPLPELLALSLELFVDSLEFPEPEFPDPELPDPPESPDPLSLSLLDEDESEPLSDFDGAEEPWEEFLCA